MKKRILTLLFLFSFAFLPIKVYAHTVKSEIVMSSEDVTKGEVLKVTVKLIQEEDRKLTVFQTRIDFDEYIFSGIDTSSLMGSNGWSDIEYNPETHTLIAINKYGTNLNEDVVSFDLKTRNDISPSKTKVGLSNTKISSMAEELDIAATESLVQVNLLSNQVGIPSNLNANFGKTPINSTVKLYYIMTIVVLELIIAIILVLIYRTVVNKTTIAKREKCLLAIVLCLIEVASASAIFYFDTGKGDLNGDKVINYEDVKMLSRHLVNSEIIPNYKLEKADLDGDGTLSVKDLSQLVERVFTHTTYEAKLTNTLQEENGYEKNSTVEVKFLADTTNDEYIEYVLIEGKKYKVERSKENAKEYTVKLKTSNISNKYDYNMTEVILANGRSAKVDYKTNIVVLKDIPTFGNFVSKEDVEHGKMDVAFTIEDFDGAITSATYELVKKNGLTAMKGNLAKGKNALSLPLENAVEYKLNIKISYNRGASSGEYFGAIEDSYDLKLITDYKFQMKDISLVQNGQKTRDIEKNSETYLEFTSNNISGYAPKKLRVNNREYTVSSMKNNRYKVRMPNAYLDGKNLNITKVTLSNGKTFTVNESLNYHILKDKPTITGIKTDENVLDNIISIDIDYNDSEYTVNRFKVELYDSWGNLISANSNKASHLELKTSMSPKYNIKVYADYDRGYGNIADGILLYETTIDAKIKADLSSATLSEKYPDKSSVVFIDYVIKSNYDTPVTKLVVDNVIYNTIKIAENTYRIEVNVGSSSGVKEYNLEKIIFRDDLEYKISNTIKLDVLKDEPILENFRVEENIEENRITATFDLFDLDSAYTGGSIRLIDQITDELLDKKDIAPGKNSITFSVEQDKKYLLGIFVDAELDTKELDNTSPNILKDEELYSVEYVLIKDYDLKFTEVETFLDGSVETSFEKNSEVEVAFTSTNKTEYYPIKIKVNGRIFDLVHRDDRYFFSLNTRDIAGSLDIVFESIILNNYKEIPLNCRKTIEVLKSAPSVENLKIYSENDEVHLNLEIDDKDSAITEMETIIKDETGTIIFRGSIEKEIVLKDFTGTYDIEVTSTYNTSTKEPKDERFTKTTKLFEKKLNLKNELIDTELLKTFEFEDDFKNISKEVEVDEQNTKRLVIRELETAGIHYQIEKIIIDDAGKVHAKISSNLLFLKDEKTISNVIIEIGQLKSDKIVLKNLP